MKNIAVTSILILLGNFLHSQVDSISILKNSLNEGRIMTNAFLNGNYDVFVEFCSPTLLEVAGGKDKMIEMLDKQYEVKEVRDALVNTELSLPEKLIIQDSIYQCTILQKQIMNFDGQKFFTLSSLVAISYNKGKKWFFISATKSLAKMQVMFPELSDDLDIVEQTAPIKLIE